MRIDFSRLTESLTVALDWAEKALADIAPMHGMRVGVLTGRMAEAVGTDAADTGHLVRAAALHDCALSEYFKDEMTGDGKPVSECDMKDHCLAGERILKKIPGYDAVRGSVLYHHERADGKGAFGKKAEETPLSAQIVHLADLADVNFRLIDSDEETYDRMVRWVRENTGTVFSKEAAELFERSVTPEVIRSVRGEAVRDAYRALLPEGTEEITVPALRDIASVFADITDYKSHFTWRHSMGIAEKAEIMGRYYGRTEEECGKLFVAGAMHDIGKLLTSNDILEKPGRLTPEEYLEIKNHAVGTWKLLEPVGGLEDIAHWAAFHHEKLDGSGYPFGYPGEKLDFNDRLLACLDIYQALVEDRPYKSGMSHGAAMGILKKMTDAGQLDGKIAGDIDRCFGGGECETERPEQEAAAVPSGTGKTVYRCPVCGYEVEGILPDDFICPRCEQPGTIFEKVSG